MENSNTLKQLTDASGYRYNFLAKTLGVSKSTFSRYLSGEISIPDDKRKVLVKIVSK